VPAATCLPAAQLGIAQEFVEDPLPAPGCPGGGPVDGAAESRPTTHRADPSIHAVDESKRSPAEFFRFHALDGKLLRFSARLTAVEPGDSDDDLSKLLSTVKLTEVEVRVAAGVVTVCVWICACLCLSWGIQ
jgi:hypothetical protein